MIPPPLQEAMLHRVYSITRRIAIGQFATPERAKHLLRRNFTHILDVSEGRSVVSPAVTGFRQVVDRPLSDFARIPEDLAFACLDVVHQMLSEPDSKVYIHCIACQNRGPTILWLYLLACGMAPEAARDLIVDRCPDAVPGMRILVDDRLVTRVREHGSKHFLPLPDPAILEPAY